MASAIRRFESKRLTLVQVFFSVTVDRFPGIESKLFNRRGNVRFPRVGMLMNDDEHNQTNRREACRDSE